MEIMITSSSKLELKRKMKDIWISINEFAKRSGVKASALRFYEEEGLLRAVRSENGRRHFARSDLRRVAFIQAAQRVGLSLKEIKESLAGLPENRTPTKQDWAQLSKSWVPFIDAEIEKLTRLKESLTSCIACGCLSLKVCALYNPDDTASRLGKGARYLEGDSVKEVLGNTPAHE